MYRVSPLTYLVDAIAAAGMHDRAIKCASNELSRFPSPSGQTCGAYLSRYAAAAGGQISNPESTGVCEYCPLTNSDQFLAQVAIRWGNRWRDFGLGFVYIGFNIFAAVALYWAFRVQRWSPKSLAKTPGKVAHYFSRVARFARIPLVGHDKPLAKVGTQEERKGKGNKVF